MVFKHERQVFRVTLVISNNVSFSYIWAGLG